VSWDCKFFKINRTVLHTIGREPYPIREVAYCTEKQTSEAKKEEIYSTLFDKGLESSGITEMCPFYFRKNDPEQDCRFYKKA